MSEKKFDWGVAFDDKEFSLITQAEELIAQLEDPAVQSTHIIYVLSKKDQPKVVADRRSRITLLQDTVGVIKRRYIEEHGLTPENVRHYDPYKIRSQRIKSAIDMLSQRQSLNGK